LFRDSSDPSRELHPRHSTSSLAFLFVSILAAEEKLPYEDIHDTLISIASTLKIFDYVTGLQSADLPMRDFGISNLRSGAELARKSAAPRLSATTNDSATAGQKSLLYERLFSARFKFSDPGLM
jgi:hypothetical protein